MLIQINQPEYSDWLARLIPNIFNEARLSHKVLENVDPLCRLQIIGVCVAQLLRGWTGDFWDAARNCAVR